MFEQMDEGGYLKQISRNGPGRGQEEKHILVDAEGILEQYPMKVQVEEKKLTRKQKQEYLDRAKEELDQEILGDNPSLEAVSQSLYLPEVLQEGAVEAEYRFGAASYSLFRAPSFLNLQAAAAQPPAAIKYPYILVLLHLYIHNLFRQPTGKYINHQGYCHYPHSHPVSVKRL